MPVEQAKDQQSSLGTDQTSGCQCVWQMSAQSWQVKNKQLWQESQRYEPDMLEFRRPPALLLPFGTQKTSEQTGKDGGKQDHLIRASTIRCSSTEHQHGKCQKNNKELDVAFLDFGGNDYKSSKSVFHRSPFLEDM
jgi:hypothetical protein